MLTRRVIAYFIDLVIILALMVGVVLAGMLLGTLSLYLCLVTVEDELFANYGLYLSPGVFTQEGLVIMGLVLAAALIAAAIPSLRVYFQAKAYNDQ